MKSLCPLLAILIVLSLSPLGAQAYEKVESTCSKAQDLVRDGKAEMAAAVYLASLRSAQKKKDLEAEWRIAQSMRRADWDEGGAATALAKVMAGLDARRAGVCVSAPACAAELVLLATRTGDRTHVPAAAKILTAFSKRSKTGAAAKTMAAYGEALATEEPAEAARLLALVLERALAEGWSDVAVCAGCERAALAWSGGDPQAARGALEKVAQAVPDQSDRGLVTLWNAVVAKRLEGAAENVLEPWKRVTGASGPHSVSAAGGRGGKGGKGGKGGAAGGGAPPKTPFQKLYDKGSRKPLFSVRRGPEAMTVSHGFNEDFSHEQPAQPYIRHQAEDGVVLGFWVGAVTVLMVDPEGRHGAPGESAGGLPPHFLGLHRLARGETLTVTRSGISIR